MMSFDFSAKRVLVTGASRGIGRGVARGFAHAGAGLSAVAEIGGRWIVFCPAGRPTN